MKASARNGVRSTAQLPGQSTIHKGFVARTVVTDGAGFIGASFVHTPLGGRADVGVIILGKFTYAGNHGSLSDITEEQVKRLKIVEGDIADTESVDFVVAGSDATVHFVVKSYNDNSLDDPSPFIMMNPVGTLTPLEAMRRHKMRFHHISTDEVYGDLEFDDPARSTPSIPYNPFSPHSSSRVGSDLLVHTWVCSFGVEATISSYSSNHGPYQHTKKPTPCMITNRLRGVRPCLYGNGLNARDWIRVRDHNTTVWEILVKGRVGETYLIGTDGETNNRDVVMIFSELVGCTPDDSDHVADCPGHDLRYTVDNTKLCEELGWSPRLTDLHSSPADTIGQCTRNEVWWAPLEEAAEAKHAAEGH